jgi:predicted AAA+ superfamily ATPase
MKEELVNSVIADKDERIISKVAKLFLLTTLKDFDVLAAVTGPRGVGKSTLTIQISRKILNLQGKEFEPERHVAYLYEDVIDKINELEEHEPLIIDEAVDVMMSEDWSKIENKYLKKVFAKLRVRHLIVFLCIPEFSWLDKKYREGMVNFWFFLPTRGFFILFTPKVFTAKEDKWELDKIENILKGINFFDIVKGKELTKNLESKLADLPTHLTIGGFQPVGKEIYEKYLELRRQAIERSSEQGEVLKIEASKIPLIIKINEMKNLGITNREIAKQLGISETAVSKYLKLISGSSK